MTMIEITPIFYLDERELQFDFIRSAGPGGQNVNKVATAVQLRFDIGNSTALASDTRGRLIQLAGKRVNADGVLLIEAKRFRTQEQNREDAIQRLAELIRKALVKPKSRKKTRPSAASKERRLRSKKAKGEIKKIRQNKSFE